MATKTQPDDKKTDDHGIERAREDDPGVVDKVRDKAPVVDHAMRMQDRFASEGGNQFSAGITYFSVLALFPLAMLVFATLATVLANRPDLLTQVQDQISGGLPGEIGDLVNTLIDQAIAQRGAVFGVGALTALWSGLGWMTNLRAGVSAMWKMDPNEGGNFVVKKLRDLVALIGLLLALILAFGVTAIGSSGLTRDVLEWLGVDGFPGMGFVIFLAGLIIGVLANFLVMLWIVFMLPRTKVPRRSGVQAAAIGALIFEVIKQLSTVIFSSALNNPAGAIFGPVIGLMIALYLIWRVVMYVVAWSATTEESLEVTPSKAPDPAIIHVRHEVREGPKGSSALGAGAALGALGAGLFAWLRRK